MRILGLGAMCLTLILGSACTPIELVPSLTNNRPQGMDLPTPSTTLAAYPYPKETAPPPAYPPVATPGLDVTTVAIVATKMAMATEDMLTEAALPTVTATPTFPVGAPLCEAADLQPEVIVGAATAETVFVMALTNIGTSVCVMQNPPDAVLTDGEGNLLEVDYIS